MTLPPEAQRYAESCNIDYRDDYFENYRDFVVGNVPLEKDLLRYLRSLENSRAIFDEICYRYEDVPGWKIFEGKIARTLGSPETMMGFLPSLGEEPE